MEELVFAIDGTFDSILCAVFDAYQLRQRPSLVGVEEGLQISFGQRIHRVESVEGHARRVEIGFAKKCGQQALEQAKLGFYSGYSDKSTLIFRYLMRGFVEGREVLSLLTHSDVQPLEALLIEINREIELLYGLVRFTLLENGIFFGKISPKCWAIPLVMGFFADRYSDQPFLIYDTVHQQAGLYNCKTWWILDTQGLEVPEAAPGEANWTRLWRKFYDTIAIHERTNPKLQQSHLPQWLWTHLPELQPYDVLARRESRKVQASSIERIDSAGGKESTKMLYSGSYQAK